MDSSKIGYSNGLCIFCGGYECTDISPCKWRANLVKSTNPSTYTEDVLHKALLSVEDLFDRILVPFTLLGNTAKSIIETESMTGVKRITVGVKSLDMVPEAESTLKVLMGDIKNSQGDFEYIYGGVPVKIRIIKGDYSFLNNPDFVFFKAGQYRIPNPFQMYWEERKLIK